MARCTDIRTEHPERTYYILFYFIIFFFYISCQSLPEPSTCSTSITHNATQLVSNVEEEQPDRRLVNALLSTSTHFFFPSRLFQTCKKKKKNRKKKKLPQVTSIYLNLHSSPQSRKRLNGTFFLLLLSLAYVAKLHKTQRCTLMYNWQRSPLRDWLPFFFPSLAVQTL